MNKYMLMVALALLSSFCPQEVSVTDKPVMQAAEGQMNIFIDRIRAGDDNLYGFRLDDDLDECTVGKPYRLLTFTRDFFTDSLRDGKDYLVIKNEWRVPLRIKGVNRNLLTVGGTSGNYVVSGMGDTTLAQELQMTNKGTTAEDDAYYLLDVPELPGMFFVHETGNSLNEAEYAPLSSATDAMAGMRYPHKQFYTLDEVEQMVKHTLNKHPEPPMPPRPAKKKTTGTKKK